MKFGIILQAQSAAVLPIRIQIVYRKSQMKAPNICLYSLEFQKNSIQLWAFIQGFLCGLKRGSSAAETVKMQNVILYLAVIIQVLP